MKRIQYNTIQACHETHADRELRENLIKERAAGPSMNSGLSNREKLGMDQFVWDVPAWVVCPGEGVGSLGHPTLSWDAPGG